jgi:hypothetical protein
MVEGTVSKDMFFGIFATIGGGDPLDRPYGWGINIYILG